MPDMARIHGFEPIESPSAVALILGSMPGQASLQAGQYYAHPHNAFWRIVAKVLQFDAAAPYTTRVRALQSAGVALWDVLQSCSREGSLDSDIQRDTQVPNDFQRFFATHRRIERVFFNGTAAETCFKRHVLPKISCSHISFVRLPSTSPAHASMKFADKLTAWGALQL
jgi:double-stranded uracil-DNA glycosylase